MIERVSRIEIPDPPEPPPPFPDAADASWLDPEIAALHEAFRDAHPMIAAGATVYRFADGTSLTHVTGWRVNNGPPLDFWSSADFSLLAHPGSFVAPGQIHYSLLLMWMPCDVGRWTETLARHGIRFEPRHFPTFPAGPATFHPDAAPDGNPPDEAALAAARAIHDHYNLHHADLKAAFASREAENAARLADRLANPPQLRDIRLRISDLTPGQAAAWHEHATRRGGKTEGGRQ